MRRFSVSVFALLLAGCQTMGPQARGPSPAEILANDPTGSCMKRLNTDPFIVEQLGAPIGVGKSEQPTLKMMADKTKPNDEQKEALSMYAAARDKCAALGAEYRRAKMPGDVVYTLENNNQKLQVLFAKLYAGDITFGEFNTSRTNNIMTMRGQLTEQDQQRAQRQAAAEAERQRNTANALQQFNNQMLLQQQINNANRPITTNCNRFGQQVSCTTY